MVTPYLSRLRPPEHGPRMHPRDRSRFEPARTFPVDGPPAGSLGLGLPPVADAETAGVEIELGQDPSSQAPAGQAQPAATPGGRGLTPARTAVPERAAPDTGRPPAPAANVTALAGRGPAPGRGLAPAGPPAGYQDPPSAPASGPAQPARAGARALPPAGTAVPGPRPGPAQAAAVTEHGHLAPQGDAGDFRPPTAAIAGREYDQAPWGATRRAPLDLPVFRASRERPAPLATPPEAAPAEDPPRVPDRPADRMSRPAEDPADRVQAMARWLRDADPAAARPSAGPPPGPPGGTRHGPGPAADTEVTVTIGRIEVKAPAAAPVPSPPQPGGPRRRVPSLDDYLESRTRARGRPG
jgi:hypothetical protein